MSLPSGLRYFTPAEFRHPELIDEHCARLLDAIRGMHGSPLEVTSDARTAAENAQASGSSPTSWHLRGRAFDVRMPATSRGLWTLNRAVVLAVGGEPVELEFVDSSRVQAFLQTIVTHLREQLQREPTVTELLAGIPIDRHVHIAFPDDSRPSVLELALT